jgi:UDP-N-acetyl-D-glucosamine dehydrogenase
MGYVGLPLALAFARRGVHVTGFDVDGSKVAELRAGRTYLPGIPEDELASVVASGHLTATEDFSELASMDVVSVCVPTPLSKSRDPDLSYVDDATRRLLRTLRPGQLVIIESTTYPGMTSEHVLPRLETSGLVLGRDFGLAFSPERVDPGNERFGIENTPKVVGGADEISTRLAAAFYAIAVETVHVVGSAAAAEMVKLLENTYRSVNIGLVNEIALMCDRLGLDANEIVAAADTKPFGFQRFDPGPGIGGHCIPLDPLYLSWKLRSLDYRARFVELAADVNGGMPGYVVSRVAEALNRRRRSLNGSRVLVLGVAYKRNVGDTRESPAIEILRRLLGQGADAVFADPYVETLPVGDRVLSAVALTPQELAAADCVLVVTDHDAFDWTGVARHARLVVDTRGRVPAAEARGTLVPLSGPARGAAAEPVRETARLEATS